MTGNTPLCNTSTVTKNFVYIISFYLGLACHVGHLSRLTSKEPLLRSNATTSGHVSFAGMGGLPSLPPFPHYSFSGGAFASFFPLQYGCPWAFPPLLLCLSGALTHSGFGHHTHTDTCSPYFADPGSVCLSVCLSLSLTHTYTHTLTHSPAQGPGSKAGKDCSGRGGCVPQSDRTGKGHGGTEVHESKHSALFLSILIFDSYFKSFYPWS